MLQYLLVEYPAAEYTCAYARNILRELLGSNYKEPEGCSADLDQAITRFYIHTPDLVEYINFTKEYLDIKKAEASKEVRDMIC